MAIPFRVIDTGVRNGRTQIAFDQALIELHREGRVPDTVRFLRFEPSALVGRHQAIGQELKLDFCRANGVALVRRITGGGAIYLD
ncbi:MAG: lipoate--protein ligase family protein, partial [Betaproteobacteria bacterium]|nr:lipoate--protein ligase family protein [Betaproteobacteria bacterium]